MTLTLVRDAHNICAYDLRIRVDDMRPAYDVTAPRKATNLTLNSDLLRQARALGINLSAELEQALAVLVATRREAQWREENRAAIAGYNAEVAEQGVFGDDVRCF